MNLKINFFAQEPKSIGKCNMILKSKGEKLIFFFSKNN